MSSVPFTTSKPVVLTALVSTGAPLGTGEICASPWWGEQLLQHSAAQAMQQVTNTNRPGFRQQAPHLQAHLKRHVVGADALRRHTLHTRCAAGKVAPDDPFLQ